MLHALRPSSAGQIIATVCFAKFWSSAFLGIHVVATAKRKSLRFSAKWSEAVDHAVSLRSPIVAMYSLSTR